MRVVLVYLMVAQHDGYIQSSSRHAKPCNYPENFCDHRATRRVFSQTIAIRDVQYAQNALASSLRRTPPPIAQNYLASARYSKTVQRLGEKFSISTRQRVVLECLQPPHAQDLLTIIPIEGLGQHFLAVEYRTIL